MNRPAFSQRGSARRVGRGGRRAFVLVGTIVCMLVASIITASVMQRSIRHRLEAQRRVWQSQADWLAQSALQRAVRQTANTDYHGETWQPQLEDPAKVEITITTEGGQRWARALANYPDHPFQRAQSEARLRLDEVGQPAGNAVEESN